LYSTCISCHARLGKNSALESFPVGRKLAFDPYKGRLWVLCSACRRWNLAPLEERWEAVEAAERLFEKGSVGASTQNIALGRVSEGLELLRVGHADRREFAGWRYGRELVSRRKRLTTEFLGSGAEGAAVVAAYSGIVAAGIVVTPWLVPAGLIGVNAFGAARSVRRLQRTTIPTDRGVTVSLFEASRSRLVESHDVTGWKLIVRSSDGKDVDFEGSDAMRILRRAFPDLNPWGGNDRQVREAVERAELGGSARETMREAARTLRKTEHWWSGRGRPGSLNAAPRVVQLALEVAVNEETERRALAGELAILQREWREAEELAAIADDLLFPRHLAKRMHRWKKEPVIELPPANRKEIERG
jgi:hypothetical protein